jgi:hypothetical protein
MSTADYLRARYGSQGPPFPGWPDPLAPPAPPPCKPDNTVIVISEDTTCDVRTWGSSLPGTRCGKPGVKRLFYGCEREHVGYADACTEHAGALGFTWSCHCGTTAKVMKTEPIGS